MIVGANERAAPISFLPGMGPDDLSQAIDAALGTADERPPVLVLTDLAGGTPARVSAELLRTVRAEVVTGVNLPMLIEVLLADPNISVAELAKVAVRAGHDGVRDLGQDLRDQGVIS
jgi:mannose/fructose-specific phosphotransferase system component IIA